MSKKNIHTVPSGNGWVKPEGGGALGPVHRTQQRAVEVGQREARNRGGEHLTHGVNGQIRARNSYGKDPFPPKG
ncbi:MAG TPA: DUF2188 domain-containing protein [Verrucomicrobiae bacterium]|nr:DUF2188 domain-containing protein [Verrucomicrobiae bacterium]